jgi:hypothetical protein
MLTQLSVKLTINFVLGSLILTTILFSDYQVLSQTEYSLYNYIFVAGDAPSSIERGSRLDTALKINIDV